MPPPSDPDLAICSTNIQIRLHIEVVCVCAVCFSLGSLWWPVNNTGTTLCRTYCVPRASCLVPVITDLILIQAIIWIPPPRFRPQKLMRCDMDLECQSRLVPNIAVKWHNSLPFVVWVLQLSTGLRVFGCKFPGLGTNLNLTCVCGAYPHGFASRPYVPSMTSVEAKHSLAHSLSHSLTHSLTHSYWPYIIMSYY